MTVHVVGAGLAGLSAAVALAGKGARVVLWEAAKQAGGRCRSYHDAQLGMVIDNGNHLVLSGNPAVGRYLRAIGAEARLAGPEQADFSFLDRRDGSRWVLRPNAGALPWWVFFANRRVPGTGPGDYLALASLLRRHPGRRIGDVMACHGPLWDKLLRPLLVSILNTRPEDGDAGLAGAVLRESLARGGRASRPRIATPTLDAAFVAPALEFLRAAGAEIRLGQRVRGLRLEGGRLAALALAEGEVPLGPTDSLVLAVPPWVAQELLPGLQAPDDFRPILNAHFAATPPPGAPAMVGLVGGTADWVFAFPDRLSTTTSDASALMERDTEDLTAALWQDVAATHGLSGPVPPCRLVKERRATFAATPAQAARRPKARTAWQNLFLAGDWTDTGLPATIEGALRSGEAAAALAFAGPGASEAAAA
ncbi:FAD-binding protein [Pseudoroseomonas wenyumeiae]|uniref:FAD-binding protein n=1 Tax=Teichococcus wenyumeiae TaxID=2478470 RepID=A0A3A9J5G1_9PROT|nr:hydroxysqualene dehydroxylase HpnE [Pseudoroseomonas wenyumeiae]RKK02447.1 FAD-binding protein [Pseudoroseomonas wenyumeiae]RMI25293.1 FAD-binding protein [Pseudoroseomonas wenyumeiae]